MKSKTSIITIGLAPAWDIICRGQDLDWDRHQNIDQQTILPAGKAFNISRALAWTGQPSIAAGLWGGDDYEQMQAISRSLWPLINVNMTAIDGDTRKNVTIVDTANQKEMHLRNKANLLSKKALQKLESDLEAIVSENSTCVFAGALPEDEYLDEIIEIIEKCRKAGAKIILDTSGIALRRITDTGMVWIVKPNVFELGEIFNGKIEDKNESLIKASRKLLDKVKNVLISRGKNGAIFLNNNALYESKAINCEQVLATVGCGDYLLAGFLKGWKDTNQADSALSTAIKVATAKAWGWTEQKDWLDVKDHVQIKLSQSK